MALTNNKDVDFLILSLLNDKDLFTFCLVNKQSNQLLQNETFWKNRSNKKFNIIKPSGKTWKNFYLEQISQVIEWSVEVWAYDSYDNDKIAKISIFKTFRENPTIGDITSSTIRKLSRGIRKYKIVNMDTREYISSRKYAIPFKNLKISYCVYDNL